MTISSAGERLWRALDDESPLQVVGAVNAYSALLAERSGFRAIYLSGAGVANASFGFPDLGLTSLNDVCEDVRRIAGATELPLLVDADTGWGQAFMIARTVRDLTRAGAAGLHIEDQVQSKRCGHRPGKALVTAQEMCDRVKAAADARPDERFVIMARTDAHAVEGQGAAVDRAGAYVEAGADMIFAEALQTLDEYRQYIEKDAALERRFQKVLVDEPSVEDTIAILRGLKEKYELHHGVRITDSALVSAATLSNRYITDRFLPDKAIDLMDEAAAKLRVALYSLPPELKAMKTDIERLAAEEEQAGG